MLVVGGIVSCLTRNEFEMHMAGYSGGKQFKMLPGFV